MIFTRQFLAILSLQFSATLLRLGPLTTIIVGVACAVGVLVSMLSMGVGAHAQVMANVRADRVILSSTGAQGAASAIPREEAVAILGLPGIRRAADGAPVVVFEAQVFMEARRRGTGVRIYFPLVGTTSNVSDYRPELHFTKGRLFQRGMLELVASNACVRQYEGFEMGALRAIHGSDWKVVGLFELGEERQCIVYADVDTVMSTFHSNTYTGVAVRLQSPAAYTAFHDAVSRNPSLHLEVEREVASVERNFKGMNSVLNFVSYFVGTIMAIGATLGAVNSLYAIVDSRRRELATLRALGFGSGVILASVLSESVILAIPGALLGCVLAWTFINGLSVSPFGFNFELRISVSIAAVGMVWALGMGLAGGLLPALRAARVPVATALRA